MVPVIDTLLANFQCALFERVVPERNEERFYYIAWQPTLIDAGAVVRVWGRKGSQQRILTTPFASLGEARPLIRRVLRRRIRNGYRLVEEQK